MTRTIRAFAALAALGIAGCSATEPTQVESEFVVSVLGERFVMRVRDPETIRLAREHIQGRNLLFPIGPLRRGDGGFNAPWSWHFDAADVRLAEAAIEVCDGLPSYVESHLADFPTYCPWSGRIVAERCPSPELGSSRNGSRRSPRDSVLVMFPEAPAA